MAASKPFWTLRVHDKRDVLVARHKARQIAHLLHFPPLEEACIAAAAFAIAAQARDQFEICDLCFHLDPNQLTIHAKPLHEGEPSIATMPQLHGVVREGAANESKPSAVAGNVASTKGDGVKNSSSLMKLAKALPEAARGFAVDDLAFLMGRINDQAPADLYGELSKQNQEILLLLHLLHHPEEQLSQKSTSAA